MVKEGIILKRFIFSVFSKPWKTQSMEELAELVRSLGFGGVEFPARDGYQVEPKDAEEGLPRLANVFGQYGLKVCSVAGETTERVFSGCAAAGVPLIRTMYGHDLSRNYLDTEAEMRRDIERYLPLCEKYGVKVGIQHHFGPGLNNNMELLHLLEPYDAKLVGGVWDAAHSGLAGEEPEQALDIIWDHLALVNFKNGYYYRVNGPESGPARFERYFTTGVHGMCSWERAIIHLKKRGYEGNVCLPAEYTDESKVQEYAGRDIRYIKALFDVIFGPDSY